MTQIKSNDRQAVEGTDGDSVTPTGRSTSPAVTGSTAKPSGGGHESRQSGSVAGHAGAADRPLGDRAPADRSPGDRAVLDHLRSEQSASVAELTAVLGVTPAAVRQRLTRLKAEGLVDRVLERGRRGRPGHRYRLTDEGERLAGDNYFDLAAVLWEEIRAVEDPAVRETLLARLAKRLANAYAGEVAGADLATRMQQLKRLMGAREVPFAVDETGDLPVITALACPYPDLAKQDRSICVMERMMMSEILGKQVELSECRLDGGGCCSFEPSSVG
ncbi:MAG: MarR family transcriptional regulator [Planctomycetota bacterium]